MSSEIIKAEIVEPKENGLTIQNPNVKKVVQEKKDNKIITTIVTNNAVLQQTNYSSGVKTQQNISVPNFNNIQERNKAIIELYQDNHTQMEVANAMNLSQSRVSQIVKNIK